MGFRAISITKLSEIFNIVEVSEIGSLLKSETIGALGSDGLIGQFSYTRYTDFRERGVQDVSNGHCQDIRIFLSDPDWNVV